MILTLIIPTIRLRLRHTVLPLDKAQLVQTVLGLVHVEPGSTLGIPPPSTASSCPSRSSSAHRAVPPPRRGRPLPQSVKVARVDDVLAGFVPDQRPIVAVLQRRQRVLAFRAGCVLAHVQERCLRLLAGRTCDPRGFHR